MTRYKMVEEARRRAPEVSFWDQLDDQGKNSLVNLIVDTFILKEQLGDRRGALLMACFGMTMIKSGGGWK